MPDARSVRAYTEADAEGWRVADSSKSLKGLTLRDAKLLDAWGRLKLARPAMTTMHVCDGLAYDAGDAGSEAVSVRVRRGD